MAIRLSALRAGRPSSPGRFLVLISVRSLVHPRAIMRLERLCQLKNPMTSSRIKPSTFRLVAPYLSQLRYRVPHIDDVNIYYYIWLYVNIFNILLLAFYTGFVRRKIVFWNMNMLQSGNLCGLLVQSLQYLSDPNDAILGVTDHMRACWTHW
jgi:hypothetical protein